jgi:hypothetical protein
VIRVMILRLQVAKVKIRLCPSYSQCAAEKLASSWRHLMIRGETRNPSQHHDSEQNLNMIFQFEVDSEPDCHCKLRGRV